MASEPRTVEPDPLSAVLAVADVAAEADTVLRAATKQPWKHNITLRGNLQLPTSLYHPPLHRET
jgi:hypothetical protein